MSIESDSKKLVRVINSCKTPEQFESSKVMISLFSKKWNAFSKQALSVHVMSMRFYSYLEGFRTAYNMKT